MYPTQLTPEELSILPIVHSDEAGAYVIGYDEDNPAKLIRIPLSELGPDGVGIPEAPSDGTQYARKDAGWVVASDPAKLDRAITPKSAAFNAAAGGQYAPDTTASAYAGTLPAAPSVGDRIFFQDPQGTWNTNNFTVARNGKKIGGVAADLVCDVNNSALWLEYVGGATEWQVFRNS